MSVTVPTSDVGEVQDKRCCGEVVWTLENGIEEWGKRDWYCKPHCGGFISGDMNYD